MYSKVTIRHSTLRVWDLSLRLVRVGTRISPRDTSFPIKSASANLVRKQVNKSLDDILLVTYRRDNELAVGSAINQHVSDDCLHLEYAYFIKSELVLYIYLLPVMNQGLWLVSWPGCTITYAGVNLVCRAKPQTSQCYDDAIVTSQRNPRHTRLVKDSWPIYSSIIGHQIVPIHV